ncbi:MAG: DUF192 domain-containing protein [Anaerolineae bacterium]|nr:DUF192 domain-containing protein [Anaerolineae bacterium]
MRLAKIDNLTTPLRHPLIVRECDTFLSRLRGLMFYKDLSHEEGILLMMPEDSIVSSSVHMFFMRFDIAVIWLNTESFVVDTVLAKRWRPAYFPRKPAKYVLEAHPGRLLDFHVGDKIAIQHE